MRSTPIKLLAGAAIVALALGGCATTAPQNSNPPTTDSSGPSAPAGQSWNFNEQPYDSLKDGGTLNISIGELTEQKNRFHADMVNDTDEIWGWYNAQLFAFHANGDLNINKNYITDLKDDVIDGNTVVTYTLNPKAVFNDGTPIDIKAFQATWKANNGSDEAYLVNSSEGYRLIKSVEAGEDNFQVVVTFEGTNPWWGVVFSTLLHPSIDSADKFNNSYVGTDITSAHPELGAGPYKLETYDSNAGVATFIPNEKWWGPKPKLDKITYTERDPMAAVNAFRNGEVDVADVTVNERLSQIKGMTGVDIREGSRQGTYLMILNSKSPLLSDIKVRQAIFTAVDRQKIGDVQFQGLDFQENSPGSLLLFPSQTGYQDNWSKVVPKFDVDEAKKLFEDAGWAMGSDGYYAKDGKTLDLDYVYFGDSSTVKANATTVQAMLKLAGVKIETVNKPASEFSNVISNNEFDVMISGFSSTDPFGVAYLCQIYCTDSQLNRSGTGTAALDDEIHAVEKLPTIDEQNTQGNKVEADALATFGVMPVYNGPLIYAVKSGLANIGSGMFAGVGTSICDFKENIGWVA